MNNPFQLKPIFMFAIILLISVPTLQAGTAFIYHSGENDSLFTNANTGNGAGDDSASIDTMPVLNDTLQILNSSTKINAPVNQNIQHYSLNNNYVPKWHS